MIKIIRHDGYISFASSHTVHVTLCRLAPLDGASRSELLNLRAQVIKSAKAQGAKVSYKNNTKKEIDTLNDVQAMDHFIAVNDLFEYAVHAVEGRDYLSYDCRLDMVLLDLLATKKNSIYAYCKATRSHSASYAMYDTAVDLRKRLTDALAYTKESGIYAITL